MNLDEAFARTNEYEPVEPDEELLKDWIDRMIDIKEDIITQSQGMKPLLVKVGKFNMRISECEAYKMQLQLYQGIDLIAEALKKTIEVLDYGDGYVRKSFRYRDFLILQIGDTKELEG